MAAAASLFSFQPDRALTGLAHNPTLSRQAVARGRARGDAYDGAGRPASASSIRRSAFVAERADPNSPARTGAWR
jgi:hypothetical protein